MPTSYPKEPLVANDAPEASATSGLLGRCALCDENGADCKEWHPEHGEVPVHARCFALFAMEMENMLGALKGLNVDAAVERGRYSSPNSQDRRA